MIETFHEENVVDANPKKAKGKSAVYNVMKWCFLAATIVGALVIFILLNNPIGEGESWTPTLITIGIFGVWTILSLVMFFVLRAKRISSICSYDYTFVSGSLRIAKVLKDVKRKPVISIECENITVMDKVSSPAFDRYSSMGGKKLIATPNTDNEDDQLWFAFFKQEGQQYFLIFEPSEVLRVHIKRYSRALRMYRPAQA